MMKKIILSSLLIFATSISVYAQQITGSVSDDNGLPLPGASIVIQGTSDGTTTDFDGNFSIESSQGSSLVISYVGYESQIIVVGSSQINVQLVSDNALDEVVVTALGISREKKSLGYSVTEVSGDDINTIKDLSLIHI